MRAANTHLRGPMGALREILLLPTSQQGRTHCLDTSVPLWQLLHPLAAPENSSLGELHSPFASYRNIVLQGGRCQVCP